MNVTEFLGLYPLFYFPDIGTAWLMGITGAIHIVASHTSVGAAILFALLARKAYKENRDDLYEYMRKYGMFLLIFSYVIGSITGPGIWYTATAASPRGISALIHNFVWVWAGEWVFFLIEVVGVFVLIYSIGKIDRKIHLKLTYLFALASVGTLFLIIGIVSFMMWPGNDVWFTTGSASDAFFGVNTFPHMIVRLGFMVILSAIIGFIIAGALKEKDLRKELARKLALIGFCGGVVVLFGFAWYVQTLPQNAWDHFFAVLWNKEKFSRMVLVGLIAAYLLYAYIFPSGLRLPVTVGMLLIIGVVGVWPSEKMRESMRKPYVAGTYVYSNQIVAKDVPGKGIKKETSIIEEKGFLQVHPFIPKNLRVITDENKLQAGELIAKLACSNCHSMEVGGRYRSLPDLFVSRSMMDKETIKTYLEYVIYDGQFSYMPKMKLPAHETDALATWLATKTDVSKTNENSEKE